MPDSTAARRAGRILTKVPEITAIGILGLCLAPRLQLRQTEYRAPYDWFAVLSTFALGTSLGDLTATQINIASGRRRCCSP